MQQLKSNRILVLLFVFSCCHSWAQDVIRNVAIQKINNNLFKINYQLAPDSNFSIAKTALKIFRRREGKEEEIFSKNLVSTNSLSSQSFYWKPSAGSLRNGDEVQAKIILSMMPSVAKRSAKTQNKIPIADAGNTIEVELPITKSVALNGSRSHDEDGKIISSQWKQISGPTNLSILNKDSLTTYVNGNFKEGAYAFELSVKDNNNAIAIGRTLLHVKAAPIVSTQPAVNGKKDTTPVTAMVATHEKTINKLKGGPLNAVVNLIVPGLGHYFVSGNYAGEHRKLTSFIPTIVYAGAIGGAFYFQNKSDNAYKKYSDLASYKEYQRDANGVIIGIRGAKEADANNYFNTAKSSHRNALICLGVSGAVFTGDFIYTILKGLKNKKEWKQASTSFKPNLFFSSNGSTTTVGVQFKF